MTVYRLDDLRIDTARQRVERAEQALDVGGLSFQLFAYLLAHGDRVVGFDELIAAVWAPAVVNEETVTQRIKLLRQALGDDGRNPRYIRSVRGRGYQLCVAAELLPEIVAKKRSRSAPLAAIALLGAVAATSLWLIGKKAPVAPAPTAQQTLIQRAQYYAAIGQQENNERAIGLYEQAIVAEPGNVRARLGLSFALSAKMCLYNSPPESAFKAQQLAEEILKLEPENSQAHAARAYALDCLGAIDSAIVAYETASRLDPAARADSTASVANLYQVKGRLADALRSSLAVRGDTARLRFLDIQIARNLELLGFTTEAEQRYRNSFNLYPDNLFSNVSFPRCLFLQGRYAEATEALQQALQRPRHPDLLLLAGELALLRGDRQSARQAFEQAVTLRPHASLPTTLARIFAVVPPDAQWLQQRIEDGEREAAGNQVWPEVWLEIAVLQIQRNQPPLAIDALRKAVEAGFTDRAYLQNSPLFHALAERPGFAEVIDTIGRRVAEQRQIVLAADWLPGDLLGKP